MSKTQDYKVMREHDGDKFYRAGDMRSLSPADAKHLVRLGVLVEAGEDDKKAPDLHDISDAERAKFETWIEHAFSDRSNAMQAEISALGERVAEAQKNAEHEITVLNETVADRRKEVEVEMEKLQQDVDAARKNADADIAEAANRKAEASTKNKAEKPNANKAD